MEKNENNNLSEFQCALEYGKNLENRIYTTKEVRFKSYHRSKRNSFYLFLALNICSTYMILFSLAGHFNLIKNSHGMSYQYFSLAGSIIILVIGLIAANIDSKRLAFEFLSSGNKANEVFNDLKKVLKEAECVKEEDLKTLNTNLTEFKDKYNSILREFENHSEETFIYTAITNPKFSIHKVYKRKCCLIRAYYRIKYHQSFIFFLIFLIFMIFIPTFCFLEFKNVCPQCLNLS